MIRHLFAYGTLQRGQAPVEMEPVVARLKPVGRGWVGGLLYDLGSFPGAVLDAAPGERIAGTVLELPDDPDFLRELDAYEEYDAAAVESSQFVRACCRARLESGESVECWIYTYNRETRGERVVNGGVWRAKP